MANATLRDLSADTDIGATDVMPKQAVDGALKKITGANVKVALESGGGIALSLAAAQRPAAGADTRVQYSNSAVTAGDADLVWDNSGKALTIGASTATAQLKLPSSARYGSPALAISGDTGLLEDGDDALAVTCGGTGAVIVNADFFRTAYPAVRNTVGKTSTLPRFLPSWSDRDTGVGTSGVVLDDAVTLIAGGVNFVLCRQKTADEDFVAFRTDPLRASMSDNVRRYVPTSFMTMVVDETNDQLEFWVKYADGVTVKAHAMTIS